ncbi:MAG: calcium/sodium antiporter [Proteobacteria bacterium]|nr:calcium/sodium antiporter [Pseudomonadota bacterium]
MTLAIFSLLSGIIFLVWSVDRFVDGASSTAGYFGMPPLLIGMVIVGFGTSAPEMVVSAMAAFQGNPGIALGNAYGSNIANISLILGITALISPITVHSSVLRKELPILSAVTLFAAFQIWDNEISRTDAALLIFVFVSLMIWTIWQGIRQKADPLANEMKQNIDAKSITIEMALFLLCSGLIILVISSRVLVWGAVKIALLLGIDDIIIGLTIVAVGTSLPELASSVIATRKGEHDIALGNVIGSNLFNTLAVVGIAGTIHPFPVGPETLSRDMVIMGALTVSLFIIGFGFRGRQGRINRFEGATLLLVYVVYTAILIKKILDG